MKTLNSFIIKISFATQTSGKSRLGRENWRMGLDKRVPVRGRKRSAVHVGKFYPMV